MKLTSAAYDRTLLGRIDHDVLGLPAARIVLLVLLAAILLTPCIQAAVQIRQTDRSAFRETGERRKTALGRWLPTVQMVAATRGQGDPYGYGHWFPTPPMVLLSLIPLSKLGYAAAGLVWALLKAAGFVLVMVLLIRELGRDGEAIPVGVLLMAGIYSLRPVFSDLQHANLNIFVLVWLGLAWWLYVRGQDFGAGLFVALAVVTKVTPGLALAYFLYKRAWRVAAGAAVGLVLFVLVAPGLYFGFERNLVLLREWFDMLAAPFVLHGYATLEIENQSLYGVLLRVLSNGGLLAIDHMPTMQALNAGMESMARPATAAGQLLKPALSVGFLAALAWLCRTKAASRRDPRLLLEFGLVLLAMLLMGERTWKHHATTLPLVYLGVWWVLTCHPWSDRFRAWCVAGLVVQIVLLLGTSEGLLGDRLGNLALDGGVFCWGLVLCFVQTAVLLRAADRPRSGPAAAAAA